MIVAIDGVAETTVFAILWVFLIKCLVLEHNLDIMALHKILKESR